MYATGDCDVDWSSKKFKYCICWVSNKPEILASVNFKQFLAFNTESIAEEFLQKHLNLIEQYNNF